MDILTGLQQRVSVSKLQSPPPSPGELEEVFKAAVRAADHGKLQPWRFLVIQGEGLERLGELFVTAAQRGNPEVSPSVIEKCRNMPRRAPMIIAAIASCKEHPSVSRHEQVIACGAAVQNMLNAFFALGYGAIWRTGDMAYDQYVKAQLGLTDLEEIVGFVYTGTPAQPFHHPDLVEINAFFSNWPVE